MEAKELRVGNYIQDVETGRKGFINRINGNRLTVKLEHSTLNQHFEEFKPIELTEEIILKCGFEKIDCFSFIINDKYKVEETIEDGVYSFRIKVTINESFKISYIKYLHQLQNLYWCLGGKELNIKL